MLREGAKTERGRAVSRCVAQSTDWLPTVPDVVRCPFHYVQWLTRIVYWYSQGESIDMIIGEVKEGRVGINSGIRRDLWRHPSSVRYSGVTAWRAVTPEPWPVEVPVGLTWSRGAEFGVVPLGDGRVYWFVALNAPPGRCYDDDLAELRRLFGGWHEPIPELMDATRPGTVLHNDIYELRPGLDTYLHGRVVLWEAHSIASIVPRFFEGRLPDLNFGTAQGASCDAGLEAAVLGVARAPERFSVAHNGRFKGGYITRHYGNPASHVHAVQLEMCQCLYMGERPPYDYDEVLAGAIQPVVRDMLDAFNRDDLEAVSASSSRSTNA